MIFPMHFFRPGDEAELYCSYTANVYRSISQGARAAPAAEAVFPTLCGYAKTWGLVDPMEYESISPYFTEAQVAYLCSCVRFVFRTAPHLAVKIIEADAPLSGIPESGNAEVPAIPESPLCSVTIPPSEIIPGDTAQKPVDPVKSSDKAGPKINAYHVEQALLRAEKISIIGEALFVYHDGYHQHVSAECLRRLIMRNCRQAVEAVGSSRLIDEVYRFLLCDPDLFRQEEDPDSELMVFDNGVLDLRSGKLVPYSPEYKVFYRINTWWGDRSEHPRFDAFLDSITEGDLLLKQRIFETIGYSLSPDTHGKCFFAFQGCPNSGKSVLANFIQSCFNRDAYLGLDITTLGDRFAASNLVGKQLCLSMDIPASPLTSKTVATFKSITGGDPITADVKYCPHVTFHNRAKFILGTNHPLLIQGEDPAFYARAVAIPFKHSIPLEAQDHALLEHLNEERAAIIFDAMQAYHSLRARNYIFSGDFPINAMFRNASGIPQGTDELIQDFVLTHCRIESGARVFIDDLFAEFCRFYPAFSVNEARFGTKVLDACAVLGFNSVHRGSKARKAKHLNPQANLVGLSLKKESDYISE